MLLLTSLVIFFCCATVNATNTTLAAEQEDSSIDTWIELILAIVVALEGIAIAYVTNKYKNK